MLAPQQRLGSMRRLPSQENCFPGSDFDTVHHYASQPSSFSGMQETYQHPVQGFLNDTTGPWTSQQHLGVSGPPRFMITHSEPHHVRPNANFSAYRNHPLSVGSNDTGLVASDSGYATQTVVSVDPTTYGQECASLSSQVEGVQLRNDACGLSRPLQYGELGQQRCNRSSQRRRQEQECPQCSVKLSCPSDLRYVSLLTYLAQY